MPASLVRLLLLLLWIGVTGTAVAMTTGADAGTAVATTIEAVAVEVRMADATEVTEPVAEASLLLLFGTYTQDS